jgi:citrate synthase
MNDNRWRTAISKVEPNKILLRGYRIEELMGRVSFAQAVFLTLKGELPTEAEARMIDAILVSCVDHGTTPQSTIAAITAASAGSPLTAAVAAGVLAISRHHGGAIEECMLFLREAVALSEKTEEPIEAAKAIVAEYGGAGRRIPGYGHLIHTADPRTARLFELADELCLSGKCVAMAELVERALEEERGRKLPLNADGAIAAVLLDMGFAPELANAFFIISRLPGLVAHIQEELARYKPLRKIDPYSTEYDGPPERKYPGPGREESE